MKKLCLTISLILCVFSAAFSQNDEHVSNPELTVSNETSSKKDKAYKYPKMDIEGKCYFLPGVLHALTGKKPDPHLRRDLTPLKECTTFMIEARGDIISIGDFAFSWSVASNGYVENEVAPPNRQYFYMGVSTGAEVYYDPFFSLKDNSMHGLCLFLYPVYEFPLYRDFDERFVHWKCAADIGINFVILKGITAYPYMRTIFAWTDDGFQVSADFGIAFGFMLFDLKYRGLL